MFYGSNMIHKGLYLLAVIKICTCTCSNESNLTTDETANGVVKYELYNRLICFDWRIDINDFSAALTAMGNIEEVLGYDVIVLSLNNLNGTTIDSTNKQYLKQRFKNVSCILLTHGWNWTAHSPSVMDPVNAFLKCEDFNLITVDWKPLGGNTASYFSIFGSIEAGEAVCNFLEKLDCLGICQIEETYAIGHSLGAHVIGILGSCVQNKTGRSLRRITGLDPAGGAYNERPEDEKLDQSDAEYIDVIHTDDDNGMTIAAGLVDFWPNGGLAVQPGCPPTDDECSHKRAYEYFTESICNKTAFPSVYCGSYDEFQSGSCNEQTMIHMGLQSEDDFISKNAPPGNYYLYTNSKAPFSK